MCTNDCSGDDVGEEIVDLLIEHGAKVCVLCVDFRLYGILWNRINFLYWNDIAGKSSGWGWIHSTTQGHLQRSIIHYFIPFDPPLSIKWIEFTLLLSTGHKNAIEMLIEKGADVNAVENTWKMTPLHFLVIYDQRRNRAHWTEDDTLSNLQFQFWTCAFSL